MSVDTDAGTELWATETSTEPGQARIRARIAGLNCSM
ncbi:hypothetical protein BH18ACT7_BH18ACT7_24760 [soil metagenome]